jgi:hypothetical protein
VYLPLRLTFTRHSTSPKYKKEKQEEKCYYSPTIQQINSRSIQSRKNLKEIPGRRARMYGASIFLIVVTEQNQELSHTNTI